MSRPCKFYPVNDRDLTPVLVPSVKSRTLEQIVANYMSTGDTSGLEGASEDSYDFADAEHIDFDADLPQSMNKIDAILHFRNIRDSLRSPMQFETKKPESVITEVRTDSETNNPTTDSNPEQGA